MSKRLGISKEVERQIFIEAGYRCAVCGNEHPLERAHIIPYSKSRDNSPENLICLCANCHERADQEKWGKKTLKEFKKYPWVLKKYGQRSDIFVQTTKVEIRINLELPNFDEINKRIINYALAAFLEIPLDQIQIISVDEGSVKVTDENCSLFTTCI